MIGRRYEARPLETAGSYEIVSIGTGEGTGEKRVATLHDVTHSEADVQAAHMQGWYDALTSIPIS